MGSCVLGSPYFVKVGCWELYFEVYRLLRRWRITNVLSWYGFVKLGVLYRTVMTVSTGGRGIVPHVSYPTKKWCYPFRTMRQTHFLPYHTVP